VGILGGEVLRYVFLLTVTIAIILIVAFYDIVAEVMWLIGYIFTFSLAGAALITLAFGALTALERWQKMRLERKRQKYEIIKDGFGMVHLLNLETDIIENLSAYPGTHHNGRWEEPHPAAAAAWFALVGKTRSESPVNLLPATTASTEPQIDLLSVMTQPTQSYAIIAGQQVGKTYQARRIAQHWISNGCKPVVIGPKWDKGEWEGCALFGGEYNFEKVSQGMRVIRRLATDRHASPNLSHKQHSIQPVFFDDWTGIRAKLEKDAEDFIIEATTLYASVNIILYFIIHLDTANAWGVGKVGAALHQNFYKLFIEPGMNEAGLIDRSRNAGYLIYPGQSKKDKKRVTLFGGTGGHLLLPDLVIEPKNEESQVLRHIAEGAPYHTISQAVWGEGKIGSYYNRKIDAIVAKYTVEDKK